MTGISESSFENSFINSIYLAKIPDQCSTSVIWLFAKCFSSWDKSCYRTLRIIWRSSFHVCVKSFCPQPGLISWQLGSFWNLYFFSFPATRGTCEKCIRLGEVSKAAENPCKRAAKKKNINQAINWICRDLLTTRLRFYQDKGTGTQRIPFPSCAILWLVFVPGVFTASSAPTGLFSLHFSVSTLKELTSLFQMRSLQVSTSWKQIGPKGRHILIMRERLRGGEKRSQHEA